jgi:hypothetical protein
MSTLKIEQILSKADILARQTASARVPDEQLSIVLNNLKRHHDVAATLTLLGELRRSSFGHRTRSTPSQLASLHDSVRFALQGLSDWQDAASIIGWARRLAVFYSQGQTRSQSQTT